MGGSPGELSEELVTQKKRKKGWRMNCDVGKQRKDWKMRAVTQVKRRKTWRMSCDVGEVTERLQNELCSPGELSEELVTQEKRKKGWRMNCDVGEATEGLENEL